MSNVFKRFVCVFMAVVMVITMVPSQAFAPSEDGSENESLVSAGSFDLDFVEGANQEQPEDFLESGNSDGPIEETTPVFSSLSGRIVDTDGQGMADVSVQIYDQDENAVLALCMTNQSGAWSSSGYTVAENHTYIIRFYKAGYSFSSNLLECITVPGENALGEIVATPAGIEIAVCNEDDYLFSISENAAIIVGYIGRDPVIITPAVLNGYPVVGIGTQAFQKNTEIMSVYVSSGVTTICDEAFIDCDSLTDLTLPNEVQFIGKSAFMGCTNLAHISAPISSPAFDNPFVDKTTLKSSDESVSLLGTDYSTIDSNGSDFTYSILNSSFISVTGYSGTSSHVVIPASIDGYTVSSIGTNAFYNCSSLTSVELPNNLKTIGGSAFYGCTGLTSMNLPDSVTSIGYRAFENCSNLQSINIPLSWTTASSGYIFSGCSKLTSLTVPEGITKLPDCAFQGCTNLASISLPSTLNSIGTSAFYNCSSLTSMELSNNLKTIGGSAFYGCTGLTSMNLPDSVTSIGYRAFENCSNLQSINIPLSWTTASSGYIFSGCSKLTNITVPEGITKLPDRAFQGCTGIINIILPSSLQAIGNYAFRDCPQLRYIELVEGLLSIGNYAFSGCINLKGLYLPDTVTTYGSNIFQDCGNLTVECKEYSFATIYCIDAGIPVKFIDESFVNSPNLCLDRNNTYYVANTVGALTNGYVTMNIAYGYKTNVVDSISNQCLSIHIPSSMILLEKTLKLDGNLLTGYEYANNLLTVNLTKTSGSISFSLKPTGDNIVTTYAIMDFKHNGTAAREVIGIINKKLPLLTILANDETNSATVPITGVGPADMDVTLYVNESLAGTAHTNKSGTYSTSVTLPSVSDYATYTLTVKSIDSNGNEITASRDIQYAVGAPVLQSFTIDYGGNTYDIISLGTIKPTVIFSSANQFSFDVKFSNPDQIEKVYICSTRSNVTKRMEATWNSTTKSYQAKGYFDNYNKSYVPGTITVEYTKTHEKVDFSTNIDYTAPKYVNGVTAPLKSALVGNTKDCIKNLVNTDKELSGVINLAAANSKIDFSFQTDAAPTGLNASNAESHGYMVIEDSYGRHLHLKIKEYAEDEIRGEVLDTVQDTLTDFCIKGNHMNAAVEVDSIFSFVDAYDYVDTLITWDNNRVSLKEARQATLSSSMSPEHQAEALQKLDYASKANNGVVAAMALEIILSVAGITIPFPCNMILPLLSIQNDAYVDHILSQFGFLDASESEGVSFNFIWKIDPSGYVYDADSNERIAGVTTTVYWIPFDECDENTKPADTNYGKIWKAEEWDQLNPILTDSEGRYAWDVPEGWWRVEYVKDGYETVWSDWMPVPPPQTDVNIGMVPTTSNDYSVQFVENTATSTALSLTNHTASTASVKFVAAAYDKDGKMVAIQTVDKALSASESLDLTVSYTENLNVRTVKAFVLSSSTSTPLRGTWSKQVSG